MLVILSLSWFRLCMSSSVGNGIICSILFAILNSCYKNWSWFERQISFTTLEVVERRTTIWCTQTRVWSRVLLMICASLCVKNLWLVTMSVLYLIYNSDVPRINLRAISSYCDFCNCVLYIVTAEVHIVVMYHISHMIQGCKSQFSK